MQKEEEENEGKKEEMEEKEEKKKRISDDGTYCMQIKFIAQSLFSSLFSLRQ